MTRLALRHVFRRLPTGDALKILGQNGARVFGLDEPYLASVAGRIGAPTPAELSVAPASLPENEGNGFIGHAGRGRSIPSGSARPQRRRAALADG